MTETLRFNQCCTRVKTGELFLQLHRESRRSFILRLCKQPLRINLLLHLFLIQMIFFKLL